MDDPVRPTSCRSAWGAGQQNVLSSAVRLGLCHDLARFIWEISTH